MATSGTTSTTLFRTQAVIDHAGRRAGLTPQQITGEHVQTALECLYLSLSKLQNAGQPLWKLSTLILPMYVGKQTVRCPLGVVDVINVNLRQLQRLEGEATSSSGVAANAFDGDVETACVQVAPDGWIQLELASDTYATNFGILPGSTGPWSYELQTSEDGVSWDEFYTAEDDAFVDGEWFWFDVQGVPLTSLFRLQAVDGTVLDVRELVIANTPTEIPLALVNRDDYMWMPNKSFQGRPTEYWLDRQRLYQTMQLWPAPGPAYTFYQLTTQVQSYAEDVGEMTDELDIPQRWHDCLVDDLALTLCLEIKEADKDRLPLLTTRAEASWRNAWTGESDRAPAFLTPRIRGYTR